MKSVQHCGGRDREYPGQAGWVMHRLTDQQVWVQLRDLDSVNKEQHRKTASVNFGPTQTHSCVHTTYTYIPRKRKSLKGWSGLGSTRL